MAGKRVAKSGKKVAAGAEGAELLAIADAVLAEPGHRQLIADALRDELETSPLEFAKRYAALAAKRTESATPPPTALEVARELRAMVEASAPTRRRRAKA